MIDRERLLFLYIGALERGDMQIIADVLAHAADDPVLGEMLDEINRLNHEEKPIMQLTRSVPSIPIRSITLMLTASVALILCALVLMMRPSQSWLPLASDDPPQPITAENVDQLTEFYRIGSGQLFDHVLSPDGSTLALVTSKGVYMYDVAALSGDVPDDAGRLIGGAQNALHAAFMPDGESIAVLRRNYILEVINIQTGAVTYTYDAGRHIANLLPLAENQLLFFSCDEPSRCAYGSLVQLNLLTGETVLFDSNVQSNSLVQVSGDHIVVSGSRSTNVLSIETGEVIATIYSGNPMFHLTDDYLVARVGRELRVLDIASNDMIIEQWIDNDPLTELHAMEVVMQSDTQAYVYFAKSDGLFRASVDFETRQVSPMERLTEESLDVISLDVVGETISYATSTGETVVIKPDATARIETFSRGIASVIFRDNHIVTMGNNGMQIWEEDQLVESFKQPMLAYLRTFNMNSEGQVTAAWVDFDLKSHFLFWTPGQPPQMPVMDDTYSLVSNIDDDGSFIVQDETFQQIRMSFEDGVLQQTPLDMGIFAERTDLSTNLILADDFAVRRVEENESDLVAYEVINMATGEILHTVSGFMTFANRVLFGPVINYHSGQDAYLIVIVDFDVESLSVNYLRGWWLSADGATLEEAFVYTCDGGYICDNHWAAINPAGSFMALPIRTESAWELHMIDINTQETLSTIPVSGLPIFSPDGTRLAVASFGEVIVYGVP